MATPGEDTLTKVSTDAATDFVQSFYNALQSARPTLSTFYSPTISKILYNGATVPDGASVQDIFVNQMPPAQYEVQSFDCQILNPNYPTALETQGTTTGRPPRQPNTATAAAKNMSLMVIVSGYVRFGEGKESWDRPNRGFSETFILVPNPRADNTPKGRTRKQWLIQSQTFRIVV